MAAGPCTCRLAQLSVGGSLGSHVHCVSSWYRLSMVRRSGGLWLSAKSAALILVLGGPTTLTLGPTINCVIVWLLRMELQLFTHLRWVESGSYWWDKHGETYKTYIGFDWPPCCWGYTCVTTSLKLLTMMAQPMESSGLECGAEYVHQSYKIIQNLYCKY